VGEPIVLFRKGFVDAVVEVFIVREDDMASYVVQLKRGSAFDDHEEQ
jgi:hypothetical protein